MPPRHGSTHRGLAGGGELKKDRVVPARHGSTYRDLAGGGGVLRLLKQALSSVMPSRFHPP